MKNAFMPNEYAKQISFRVQISFKNHGVISGKHQFRKTMTKYMRFSWIYLSALSCIGSIHTNLT